MEVNSPPRLSVTRDRASVSVVVCAYSDARFALLEKCLELIVEELGNHDELIVVIDHNDALLKRLSGTAIKDKAQIITNASQRGLSGARNTGVSAANAEVVAFVDDDAQVCTGWMQQLRDHYKDAKVTGVGGYADPVWPNERPAWFPAEFDWVVGCSHRGLPTRSAEVRNFIGCNMSFRRVSLLAAGGFSTRVGRVDNRPVGCEETELCIRLTQMRSGRLVFDPAIKVRHWVSDDRARLRYFLRRCFLEGVSKQIVGGLVGSSDALRSEREYTAKVLPRGVARRVVGAISGPHRRGDLAQGCVIVTGLLVTTLGYSHSAAQAAVARGRHARQT